MRPVTLGEGAAGKLATQVAQGIEASILTNGWPPDHYVGREEQLSEQFGASRAVIREAIAIAEWNGTVERRRGREGGVYVSAWKLDPAVAALRNFLFLGGAGLGKLVRARRLLEGQVLSRAVERVGPADVARVAALLAEGRAASDDRTHVGHLKQIVDWMSDLAGSPVLSLMSRALRHCYVDRVRTITAEDREYLAACREVARLRMRQVEAILDYDVVAARDLQTRALDIWDDFAEALPAARLTGSAIVDRLSSAGDDAVIYEFVRPAKKAEAVARAIAQSIADAGSRPGHKLGTEGALIEELGVSRRAFREGLRILERFGVVASERGKGGGLIVARPQRLLLSHLLSGASPEVVRRQNGETAILQTLLAEAVSAIVSLDLDRRMDLVREGRAAGGDPTALTRLLADHVPDVVIGSFLIVLAPLWTRFESGADDAGSASAVLAIYDAIAAGDRAAAPRLVGDIIADFA